jgi:arsenite oxidase large subunit
MPLDYTPQDSVPLPPKDAEVHTTACDYCIVGCGYKVYTWPVGGSEGGPNAEENALGADFPGGVLRPWISPNQHNIVQVDGQEHHVVVLPDFEAQVVNRLGNHSIRGGTLALKCYNPDSATRERLLYPQIRVDGELTRVDWDVALDVMAAVSQHVLKNHGESAWAMKTYSYEFFENTYAITKLAFGAIKTPAFAPHDKPGAGNDTAGVDDAGIVTFSASYEDWGSADVLFISGTDPFETKTIVFTEWMMKSGAKMIMVLPRRSAGVAFAESTGGLFLQIIPGTDALLHMAISRIILENGWEDQGFIDEWVATNWEIGAGMGRATRNTPWQWRTTWGKIGAVGFEDYKEWLLSYEPASLEFASRETGIPPEKIRQAAEMLTGAGGERPKASFGFEKGNYWSNNYLNTASFAAMGLLCGAGNRAGRVISRLGGHQRGWIGAAGYPRDKSPEKLPGRRKVEMDLDRWVEAGKVRFTWVVGTTWTGAMAASQELARRLGEMTVESPHQVTSLDKEDIIDTLIQRVESGGMVIVNSDLYPVEPLNTELADIVLPAAAWGEHDAARCNGERRLRLYSKFYDVPGETKPDWWAISRFAQKMGFEGFDWEEDNDVFEEAARFSRGGVLDYFALVWKARGEGVKGHEALRALGTTGIQTPIRYEAEELVGTKRLHDPGLALDAPEGPTIHSKWLTHFKSHSGKALLIKSPWEIFSDFYERIKPDRGGGRILGDQWAYQRTVAVVRR